MLFTLITLWFDVGIVRYTTPAIVCIIPARLWFDVGIVRYTTEYSACPALTKLWFDVGIVRYTTKNHVISTLQSCGLM